MSHPAPDPAPASSGRLVARLSVMMFLQYWSLGLWFVTVKTFIAANTELEGEAIFSAGFIGYSATAAALGSLVAPALMGWIADRFFSAEKLLAVLHVGAGAALWWMHGAVSQTAFFIGLVLYFQMFGPTVALTNTVAFSKLADRDREFPIVRLYGTVAWITAGVFIGIVCPWWLGKSIEPTRVPMTIAAWSHIAMAAYSLTLPSTRPQRTPRIEGATDRRVWQNPTLMLFLAVSLFVAITSQAYDLANVFLNQQGYQGAAATLTLGQLTEVACLAAMPWLAVRMRLKTLFVIGVLGWAFRYLMLALGSYGGPETYATWFVYAAILVHGPSYVFVYLAGQMYVDRMVDPSIRGVAQGLHAFATVGVGHFLGACVTGWSQSTFLTPAGVTPPPYNWAPYWLMPVGLALLVAALFGAFFTESEDQEAPATVSE